jgi:hypothetical protein
MTDEGLRENIEEVAGVLQELKREVRNQRQQPANIAHLAQAPPAVPRLAVLEQVHSLAQVNPHLPIAWPHWPKGLWPKIVAATKKVVRRMLSWYINPIVEQQNRFNAAVAQSLDMLWAEIAHIQVQVTQDMAGQEPEGE